MNLIEELFIAWLVVGAIISIPMALILNEVYNVKLKKGLIISSLIIESSIIVILSSMMILYELFVR